VKKHIVFSVVLAILLVASAYAQTTDFFDLVKTGTPQQIQIAINKGADVNALGGTDENYQTHDKTPLMYAAGYNPSPEVISTLLKAGANIKAQDVNGDTPLMWAVEKNQNPKVVSILLKAGADIESHNKYGQTPLMAAAADNQNSEVITTLLKAGADVKARNTQMDWTPLMAAAAHNQNPEVITTLLKAGADVKARTNGGWTTLMYAAADNPNPEVISTLLKAGADAKAKDNSGKTAFDHAQDNAKLKETDAYKQLEEVSHVALASAHAQTTEIKELPGSFTGTFTDENYTPPDVNYISPYGGNQNGWLINSIGAADMNAGTTYTFTKVFRSEDGSYTCETDDPDEAIYFSKIDINTIKIMVRDRPAGAETFFGPGSSSKAYTLKRRNG
jgi:hypothetical protein